MAAIQEFPDTEVKAPVIEEFPDEEVPQPAPRALSVKLDPYQKIFLETGQKDPGMLPGTEFTTAIAKDPVGFVKSIPGDIGQLAGTVAAGAMNLPERLRRTMFTPKETVTTLDEKGRPQMSEQDQPLPFRGGVSFLPKGPFVESENDPINSFLNKLITGMATPEMVTTLPFAQANLIKGYFLTQTVPGAIEGATIALDSTKTPKERIEGAMSGGVNSLFSYLLGKSGPKPEAQGPLAPGEVLQTPKGALPLELPREKFPVRTGPVEDYPGEPMATVVTAEELNAKAPPVVESVATPTAAAKVKIPEQAPPVPRTPEEQAQTSRDVSYGELFDEATNEHKIEMNNLANKIKSKAPPNEYTPHDVALMQWIEDGIKNKTESRHANDAFHRKEPILASTVEKSGSHDFLTKNGYVQEGDHYVPKAVEPVAEAIAPEAVGKPTEQVFYHGTKSDYSDADISTGKKMFGIHLTTDEGVAKIYARDNPKGVKQFTISPESKVLDLAQEGSDDLWQFMRKHKILDAEQSQNVDLENYVNGGKLFQYDLSSRTHYADDVARTAKDLGYDIVKMPDDLGGKGGNTAHVVVNPKVLKSIKETPPVTPVQPQGKSTSTSGQPVTAAGGKERRPQVAAAARSVLEPYGSVLSGFAHGKETIRKTIPDVSKTSQGKPIDATILDSASGKVRVVLHGRDDIGGLVDAGALLRPEVDSFVVENIASSETVKGAIPALRRVVAENLGKIVLDKNAPTSKPAPPAAEAVVAKSAQTETGKEAWQMTRSEYSESAKPNANLAPEALALDAISKKNNRRPYNPDLITENAVEFLRKSKLVSGKRDLKLTSAGYDAIFEQNRMLKENDLASGSASDNHIELVEQALREGKPVPPEVLADYPDLKPAPAKAETPAKTGKLKIEQAKVRKVSTADMSASAKELTVTLPDGKILQGSRSTDKGGDWRLSGLKGGFQVRGKTAAEFRANVQKSFDAGEFEHQQPPPPIEPKPGVAKSPIEILNTAERLKFGLPKGQTASFIRLTDKNGGIAIEPIKGFEKRNTAQNADIVKFEAGNKSGKKGEFIPIKGDVTVAEKGIASDWTSATEEIPSVPAESANVKSPEAKLAYPISGETELHAGISVPKFANRKMSPLDKVTAEHSGKIQKSFDEARRAQKEIRAEVPSDRRQAAISIWREAKGDMATLQTWANAAKGKMFKRAAIDAQTLTPKEIAIATKSAAAFDILHQRGVKFDILKSHRDAYVPHVWDVKKPGTGWGGGMLKQRFRFSKARTFDTFFDGDQAGFKPKTLAIGKLLPAYIHEMNKVIADRQLVRDLVTGTAKDGSPLSVPRGNVKTVEGDNGQAVLVQPRASRDADTSDYRVMSDQPALSNWIWEGKDTDGKPVFVKADLALHPEAYRRLTAILGQSAIRSWYHDPVTGGAQIPRAIVRGLDTSQSAMKREMFGLLAPFHQVQEGTHAVGHLVNPFFGIEKVDLTNPRQMDAVNHGLMMLPDRASSRVYLEGVGTHSSLLSRGIRKVGKLGEAISDVIDGYQDYLFHQYIPALKFKTYEAMLGRNTKLYAKELASGEMALSDVKITSAEQANAAYGHLNYALLDRNPTMQHLIQLSALAPDFLEARVRFAAQGVEGLSSKVGHEQFKAIAILAAVQAGTAFTLSQLLGDKYDPKHPFEVIHKGRRYAMRSVPEDIFTLLKDTRQFAYSRVNPLTVKGGIQLATGLNYRGEKVTPLDTVGELLAGYIPITARQLPGLRSLTETSRNNPVSPLQQLAGSLGLRISRYSPISETYKLAGDWMDKQKIDRSKGSYPVSQYQQLRYALEDGDMERAGAAYAELLKNMKASKIATGFSQSINHPFTDKKANDAAFAKSLSGYDKELYKLAVQTRARVLVAFQKIPGKPMTVPPARELLPVKSVFDL